MKNELYVASSWRNEYYSDVLVKLIDAGLEPYDFKNPVAGNTGFHWSEIDPDWLDWTPEKFAKALSHPLADEGFAFDMAALDECKACILVLPAGRSAHLEAGYARGAKKPTYIYCPPYVQKVRFEPELMYKMTKGFYTDLDALIVDLKKTMETL